MNLNKNKIFYKTKNQSKPIKKPNQRVHLVQFFDLNWNMLDMQTRILKKTARATRKWCCSQLKNNKIPHCNSYCLNKVQLPLAYISKMKFLILQLQFWTSGETNTCRVFMNSFKQYLTRWRVRALWKLGEPKTVVNIINLVNQALRTYVIKLFGFMEFQI